MTFSPKEESDVLSGIDLARFELAGDLGKYFNMAVQQAAALNTTLYSLPVITCANATATQPVMQFSSGNETKISLQGSCVIVEALSGEEFTMMKDRILYGMFGVIG